MSNVLSKKFLSPNLSWQNACHFSFDCGQTRPDQGMSINDVPFLGRQVDKATWGEKGT